MPPIITEPKKLSMPQQVEKNREDIKEIFKKIDGLDTLDNVVVIDDLSHVLTPEEVISLRQPVAFIIYNNHIYLKRSEASNIGYFQIVFSISGTNVITFDSSQIKVYFSSGSLEEINSSFSAYSVSKIDSLLLDKASISYVDASLTSKASLSGADFSGPITAPSITENMSGYSYVEPIDTANITFDEQYVGVVKNGNKITFVTFIKLTLNATVSAYSYIGFGQFVIPSSIGSKLQPFTIGASETIIACQRLNLFSASNLDVAPKTINMFVRKNSNAVIEQLGYVTNDIASGTYFARYEVTFLLSENLVQ